MYSSMAKGTSRAEATLNSEKIKPVALSYASLKGSGRKAGRRAARRAGRQAGGQAGRQAGS